ncbi:MAG: RNA methyltransferase [Ignavibacteria bacterium]|nr:RNA methyltransferase [Ignavibacteria bacterium]
MSSSLQIQRVESLDLPELQPYRTLRRPMDHLKEGIFVAEGEKVVRRLLASGLHIVSLLLTNEWLETLQKTATIPDNVAVFVSKKEIVETIVGYNLHQGIMAIGKVPAEPSLDGIVRSAPHPHLFVALDGLANAENVGVVVRNCSAFGVDAIIVGETSSSPYLRRAVRNSMGTVFQMPVLHTPRLTKTLTALRQMHRATVVAAHPHKESSIFTTNFPGNVCIVLGNEGEGISREVLDACDAHIAIPMMNGTDSLNVASASAVFLYEVRRQRRSQTPT